MQEPLHFRLVPTNPDFFYFTAPVHREPSTDSSEVSQISFRHFSNLNDRGEVQDELRELPGDPRRLPARNPQGTFATLEIQLTPKLRPHHLALQARKTRWVYLVPRGKHEIAIRDIEDGEPHNQIQIVASPQAYNSPLIFKQQTSQELDETGYLRFYSEKPVPFHELPKRNLVLSRQSTDAGGASPPLD